MLSVGAVRRRIDAGAERNGYLCGASDHDGPVDLVLGHHARWVSDGFWTSTR